ncbi:hypothetical protein JCM3770_003536 [Rhodotorula araucariae]
MSRSTKPSAAGASRPSTSRVPRASTSQQVNYLENDDLRDMHIESDRDENFEDEDDGSECGPATQDFNEISRIYAAWKESRVEKNKEKLAKAEKQMQGVLDKGRRDADAAIKAQLDKNVTLMQSANLSRPSTHSEGTADEYEKRFADMQKNSQLVAAAIDEIIDEVIKTGDTECVGFAKEAFEARSRAAKRTYKKLSKTNATIREEAFALTEEQHQSGETLYRHLKAAARA